MDTELLWAAGLFIGEGSVYCKAGGSGTNKHVYLKLAMYDERAVRRFAAAISPYVGERTRRGREIQGAPVHLRKARYKGIEKTYYSVDVGGNPALPVCEALYPLIKDTDKGDQMRRIYETVGREIGV